MFDWLSRTASRLWHGVTGDVSAMVHTVIGGVVALLSTLFGRVGDAWHLFTLGAHDLETAAATYGKALWGKLAEVVHYWIPHLAFTAWWWVTHPSQLAHVLLWHLLARLEANAYTAAGYLGEFAVAMLMRNTRRVAHLTETILAAVL